MKWAVRTTSDLGPGFVLAPERHVVLAAAAAAGGVSLEDLVVERIERVSAEETKRTVVLDTTHVKEGVLDVESARLAATAAKSQKKRAHPGDVLVSRLRPYLRQIAYVHPAALGGERVLTVSTEFYVLAPRKEPIAWLVPWLLSGEVQAALSAAQEGGHHPRVPRASLFALKVPEARCAKRKRTTTTLERALEAYYAAASELRRAMT